MEGFATIEQRAKAKRAFQDLLGVFRSERRPIPVDFRSLVDWLPSPDRFTHLVHPYPAKLLVQIPHFFLAHEALCAPAGMVLDPFAGSGTVLLEALLSGRRVAGADPNPVALLLARVKTTPVCPDKLRDQCEVLLKNARNSPCGAPPKTVGLKLDYWFLPHVMHQLQALREVVLQVSDSQVREFFLVCFSSTVRKVSLANPRLSVPVKMNPMKYPGWHPLRKKSFERLQWLETVDVHAVFAEIAERNTRRMRSLWETGFRANGGIQLLRDARDLGTAPDGTPGVPNGSVDLIVTSPPYSGAQKYIRAQSLSMAWLGLLTERPLIEYKHDTIGREEYRQEDYREPTKTDIETADGLLDVIATKNPLRAHILAEYLNSMRVVLAEAHRVLAPGGSLVLVSGNNTVCGQEVPVASFLKEIAEKAGFTEVLALVDDIRSRGLMTKRNKTAGLISQEWVNVFRKVR